MQRAEVLNQPFRKRSSALTQGWVKSRADIQWCLLFTHERPGSITFKPHRLPPTIATAGGIYHPLAITNKAERETFDLDEQNRRTGEGFARPNF
jgi:hypothetical protein